MADYEIAEELIPLWHLGYRTKNAIDREQADKLRKLKIWDEQGRPPELARQWNIVLDPNEEMNFKRDILDYENKLRLLSEGTYDDHKKAAFENAVQTVLKRHELGADISKNVATQLGNLRTEQLGVITEYGKLSGAETGGKEFLKELSENMGSNLQDFNKSEAGGAWALAHDGRKATYLNSPVTADAIVSETNQFGRLFDDMKNWEILRDPKTGETSYDQSKVSPASKELLAKLEGSNTALKGSSDRSLLAWVKGVPGAEERAEAIEAALEIAKKFKSPVAKENQEDVIDDFLKEVPGVTNSSAMAREITQETRRFYAAIKALSDDTKNIGTKAALQKFKLAPYRRLASLPNQLKTEMMAHPLFPAIAAKLGVDPTTDAGKEQTIKFISKGGYRYFRDESRGAARTGLQDLKSGAMDLSNFYLSKATPTEGLPEVLPTADPEVPIADPEVLPTEAPLVPTVDPDVPVGTEPVLPVEDVGVPPELVEQGAEAEVDLLADEDEGIEQDLDVALPEAADVEAAETRRQEDEAKDLAALEQGGDFEQLLGQVSENDPRREKARKNALAFAAAGGEDSPLAEAFGHTPPMEPESTPELIARHQASQAVDNLKRVRIEQRRQKILEGVANVANVANQIPQSIPAESAGTPAAPIGTTDEDAYARALEMAKANWDPRTGLERLNPTDAARSIAARKLAELNEQ